MAARLTDKQKKEIIADYIQLGSYNAVAKLHGVSKDTVKRVVQSCEDFAQKEQQKKEENTADILAFMEKNKDKVCSIIELYLDELLNVQQFEKVTPNQLTTAIGTLIDKWVATKDTSNDKDKVMVIIDV